MEAVLQSGRLELVAMTPAFLEACLAGDAARAEAILGVHPPPEWLQESVWPRIRLGEMQEHPTLQTWLLRAIRRRGESRMIGYIGCHTAPDPSYLQETAPGGIEFGYTIYPEYRRQGYAYEACRTLMDWAHRDHGVVSFVVSISPENVPSLALARKLGFVKVGAHIDEVDGPEDVFLLRLPHSPSTG